jgi:hypothetical protein
VCRIAARLLGLLRSPDQPGRIRTSALGISLSHQWSYGRKTASSVLSHIGSSRGGAPTSSPGRGAPGRSYSVVPNGPSNRSSSGSAQPRGASTRYGPLALASCGRRRPGSCPYTTRGPSRRRVVQWSERAQRPLHLGLDVVGFEVEVHPFLVGLGSPVGLAACLARVHCKAMIGWESERT